MSHAARPSPNPPTSTGRSAAEFLLDAAAQSAQHDEGEGARAWLRKRLVRETDLEKYGLRPDDGWDRAASDKPVVVFIHGFNSSPQQNAALMLPIRASGFPCAAFAYPNDYLLRDSARLLSGELSKLRRTCPRRKVILIGHSMGGLVARACVEDSRYDPGNVERLIMIAPPTHGTIIAHFAVGTDVWEHWLARPDGWPWQRARDSIVDGLGEAAGDLCLHSDFLQELNSRPLNPRIRYTVLLGTGARLSDGQVAWIRKSVCGALTKVPGGATTANELQALLADIDELVAGKGDGVVAVKRGRLNGVADTLVMPFGHLAVTGEATNDLIHDVQRAVLARVQ